MKLILSDPRPEVLNAWRAQFLKRPEVEIRAEPVLETAADAVLLPGNSFGFLDSGLSLEVSERYGWAVEEELRRRIRAEHEGELLVGQALVVRLPSIPRVLVYSPVWRTPRKITATLNVFLAVRGALLAARKDAGTPPITGMAVPALGLDAGEMDPRASARQIRYAYEVLAGQRGPGDKNLTQQVRREKKLLAIPGLGKEGREEAEDGGD